MKDWMNLSSFKKLNSIINLPNLKVLSCLCSSLVCWKYVG